MIEIRAEQPRDIRGIREVNKRAFGQPQEADLIDTLRESCCGLLSLVAVYDEQVVGHILFSPATIETNDNIVEGVGLAPMAVLPEFQQQGIGIQLVEFALREQESSRCPFIIVLGYPEYYSRFGFVPASRYSVRSEWDVPDNVFMIKVLDRQKLEGIHGIAKYRPEFALAM